MRLLSLLLAAALSCATAAPRASAAGSPAASLAGLPGASAALAPDSLGPYPSPDSVDGKADLAILLWLQRTRTPEDNVRAQYHGTITIDRFAPAFSGRFDAVAHPASVALLNRAHALATAPIDAAKDFWRRRRPYEADRRVQPSVPPEPSFAYPSGHATRGILVARVLAELAPERRAALLTIGRQIGYDRVVGGVHYPSDVVAGERLGDAIADALLADVDFRRQLEETRRAEWSRPN